MTDIRPELKKGQWKMSKHSFYATYHYALKYNEWKDRKDSVTGLNSTPSDGMPHSSSVSNPTESKGILAAEMSQKMKIIEDTVMEADEQIYKWLLKGVTNEGITYHYLDLVMNIPCGRNKYYESRRKFYYLLAKKMNFE